MASTALTLSPRSRPEETDLPKTANLSVLEAKAPEEADWPTMQNLEDDTLDVREDEPGEQVVETLDGRMGRWPVSLLLVILLLIIIIFTIITIIIIINMEYK